MKQLLLCLIIYIMLFSKFKKNEFQRKIVPKWTEFRIKSEEIQKQMEWNKRKKFIRSLVVGTNYDLCKLNTFGNSTRAPANCISSYLHNLITARHAILDYRLGFHDAYQINWTVPVDKKKAISQVAIEFRSQVSVIVELALWVQSCIILLKTETYILFWKLISFQLQSK